MTPEDRKSLLQRVLDTWTEEQLRAKAEQWSVDTSGLARRPLAQRLILEAEQVNDIDLLYAQLQPGGGTIQRSVSPEERRALIQEVLDKWPRKEELCDAAFEAGVDATGVTMKPIEIAKKMVLRVENDGQVKWLRERIGVTARHRNKAPSWTYVDFDVAVESANSGYAVKVLASPAGQARATTQVVLTEGPIAEGVKALRSTRFDVSLAKNLGSQLLANLLTGDVGTAYNRTLGIAENQGSGVRLRLRINAPELKALPWEYLYDTQRDNFLAVRSDVVISRYLEVVQGIRTLPPPSALRILVLLSGPKANGLPKLDLEGEEKRIREALAPLEKSGEITLDFETNPTTFNIRERLWNNVYHIIHYSGHAYYAEKDGSLLNGQPVTKDTGYVVLPDDDGNARLLDETSFAAGFNDSSNIRLVILNTCKSAQASLTEYLSGLGDKLVQTRGIPAVIAMQFPIADTAAKIFAREFYTSLAGGQPIDAAVARSRLALKQDSQQDARAWATPVLFMRSADGKLFA